MKRIMTGLFALLLCAALYSGCGAQAQPASSAAPETTAAQTTAPPAETTEAAEDEVADSYKVLVTDEAGKPVSGVSVQFCSDTECKMEITDEDGITAFNDPEGKYTVHILKAPDGFAADSTEYEVPEKYGTLTIVLVSAQSASDQ